VPVSRFSQLRHRLHPNGGGVPQLASPPACSGSHWGLPDGRKFPFAVATHGKDGMPAFRSDLTAKERWLVVAYLKTLK
jgi:mono/diheme cytochrome c family protein